MPAQAPSAPLILVVDDDAAIRAALRIFLKSEGYEVELLAAPELVPEALARSEPAVLLVDLNYRRDTTSGDEGLDLIREVSALDTGLPIVAMTAWGTVALAVEAMRLGASDFIEKPWDNNRLASMLRTLSALRRSRQDGQRLAAENELLKQQAPARPWVCESPAMRTLMQQVEAVSGADVNLLITGENGCGKTQLAQAIHQASARAAGPFISVNMGAIPDGLFESEMFGHERGAFTDARQARMGRFELADGGTLFLDEVGNIPLAQQAKLLQVLESGQFERLGSARQRRADVRLIAASNADLQQMVEQGLFRRDLLYRLNSLQLHLPPLRERGEDIQALADLYLSRFAQRYQRPLRPLSAEARRSLAAHRWPGNVRELAHCMERVSLLASGAEVSAADLGLAPPAGLAFDPESMTLEEAEKLLIATALRRSGGNALAAAQALGLSRSAFYRRLEKHQL
ncbi:sigma-54 dependent transcriptional regulator [Pelomonas sp. SE-A7]|uniref:sigma-54-dependent transcriptional regulator n=1 Tax=Pelomonas sp. SE-A7 TaxID=3054953 RepID=UPI00259CC49D|nr:sigma-54 dependent transcriptional regulator [Pelomonas sp. SE-A7]MDM4765515.1 sigma-54 dependent transcriptional regulator [Pelomonas sp. SE-A7]